MFSPGLAVVLLHYTSGSYRNRYARLITSLTAMVACSFYSFTIPGGLGRFLLWIALFCCAPAFGGEAAILFGALTSLSHLLGLAETASRISMAPSRPFRLLVVWTLRCFGRGY